jgi:hypothetical protein
MRKIQYSAEEWAGLATPKAVQWRAYLSTLWRPDIATDQLWLMLVKQDFRCALSGVLMTNMRVKGQVFPTNASIDRIVAGSAYRIENVQLVCMQINRMKRKLTVDEFIRRCHAATKQRTATEWQVLVSEFNSEGNT